MEQACSNECGCGTCSNEEAPEEMVALLALRLMAIETGRQALRGEIRRGFVYISAYLLGQALQA